MDSSLNLTTPFKFETLPLLIQEKIIRFLSPKDLISFSQTSLINYKRCRQACHYPLKSLIIDMSQNDDQIIYELHDFASTESRKIKATEKFPNKLVIIESLIVKGFNPINGSEGITEEKYLKLQEDIEKIIPKLSENLSISLNNLIPTNIVQLIIDSAKNVYNYDMVNLHLTEPIKITQLFTNVSKIQNIEISNKHGIEFNEEIFAFLQSKSSPDFPLQSIIIHDFFNTPSFVSFAQNTPFKVTGKVEFITEKAGRWNYFSNLYSRLQSVIFPKNHPKIAINGSFLRLPTHISNTD